MNKTAIEYVDYTWNPVTGCLNGCEYCYARRIANRCGNQDMGYTSYPLEDEKRIIDLTLPIQTGTGRVLPYPYGFHPTFHRHRLDDPAKLKKPSTVFVCSMADLFGDWVPDEWIYKVFEACEKAPQHRYLFLTKNPARYRDVEDGYSDGFIGYDEQAEDDGRPPFLFGATVTNEEQLCEAYESPAEWLSIEPLLEDISDAFDECSVLFAPYDSSSEYPRWKWVVIGAETGNRKDKVVPERAWIDSIVKDCRFWKTPVFMKGSLKDLMGTDFVQELPWEEVAGCE
ncbi:MAG: phage Gp37/Gp68 family protein [Peptococcaceae bacterium]|nr:phage Gp37/Gp68 family protein [Peptococcaceae bacterium]